MIPGRVGLPILPGRVPSAVPVPKVNSPTQAPTAAAGDQVYVATIVSVDNPSNPTVATVAPNNALPLLSGFTIPSSLGVTFQMAPYPFTAPPMNVAYYNNTTTNSGGAFCWVDVTSRTILSLAQGDSLTAPTNDAALFQFIEHNGAYNTGGNFQNPAPIDNTQLLGNPYPTHAPVFCGSPSSFTYFGAGSGAFDAEISFTLNFNTSPWFSTTNLPVWLCEVGFLAVPNGSAASTLSFPFGKVLKGVQAPTSTASYTAIFDGLSAANTYDLYVYFIDMKGNCSTAAYIASTVMNPLIVGNANQQGYPGTLSSVNPTATFVSNNGVSLNNGTTFDASISFSTDSNGYVSGTNQWLAEIQLWAQVHGTTGKAFQAGNVPPLGSGNYSGVWPSLGNGTIYDVMIRYIDYKGNYSGLSNIITQVSASGVGKAALTTNPNPTVAPAYISGHTPTNNGGSNTDTHFTYTTGGGGSYDVGTNFELDANFTISSAAWLQQINVYAVANGAGTNPITPSSTANIVNLPAINPGNGSYNVSINGLSAGIPYALYIAYMDLAGNVTPATLIAVTTAQYINGGTITSIAPNMVVDSGFAASNFNSSGVGSNNPYWAFEFIDGISFQIAQAGSNEPNSSQNWPTNLLRIVSGDSGKKCQALSEVISVTPSSTYYFSAFFGGGHSSGTMPYAAIVGTNWNLGSASGTIYQQISPTSPVNQQTVTNFSSPWTCPSGITQVCFLFNENNNTIGGGDSLYMGAPFFSMQPGPYTAGPLTKSSAATSAPITDSNSTGGGPVNSAGDTPGTTAHAASSAGTQLAVTPSGTVNVARATTGSLLPYANHSTAVQDVIGSGGNVNVNPGGGVSGNLPLANHAAAVTSTITGTADAFGNYLKTGVVSRLALTNSSTSYAQSGSNLIVNPTGAVTPGVNSFTGWTPLGYTGIAFNWQNDGYAGGRFFAGSSVSVPAGEYNGFTQIINVIENVEMTISAIGFMNVSPPTNGYIIIDVLNSSNAAYSQMVWTTSGTSLKSFTFNTGASPFVTVRMYIINDNTVTETLGNCGFYQLQLEYGTQPSTYVDHTGSASGTSVIGATLAPNLVVNGNNCGGTGSVAPTSFGWTTQWAGSMVSAGTYIVNGVTYDAFGIAGAGTITGWYNNSVPVIPGQTYTYCALVYCAAGATGQLWIGNTAVSTQWNSNADGTPSGSVGAFYSNYGKLSIGRCSSTTTGQWEVVCGTFTVPSGAANSLATVFPRNTTGAADTVYFAGIQLIQGTRLQDYHDAEPAGAILGKGNAVATASSAFNPLCPNLLDWTTTVVLEYAVTGTSPNLTLKLYYDNGTAATDATIYNPDGSTVDIGHTTSSSPSTSLGSLTTGATVYYMVYYAKATGTMSIQAQTSPFTITQINAAYADGGYVAFNATTTATGNTLTASPGGSGGIKGGGGGGNRY